MDLMRRITRTISNEVQLKVLLIQIVFFCAVTIVLYNKITIAKLKEIRISGSFSHVYHSPDVFKLSYEEMERKLKVFIYPDGDEDAFYHMPGSVKGRYASEGYFFQNIRESRFRTRDPREAHLFFIPISCHKMRGKGLSYWEMTTGVKNYVRNLILKFPYWNRTLGTDHFFVTCHDIGVRATEGVPHLVKNSIRVVCFPSHDIGLMPGFIPHKDIALPLIRQPFAHPPSGNNKDSRIILGFWGGKSNRDRLVITRENDGEQDIPNNGVNKSIIGEMGYRNLHKTKFCMCPSGANMNTACIADSIHYGCIPVILADHYVLPFNTILDWRKFSVILSEEDVNDLEYTVLEMKDMTFATLHQNVVKVQKHFQWNLPARRYDAFHMVMYELWMRHHVMKYI